MNYNSYRLGWLAGALLAAAVPRTAPAPIFMKYEDIKGESLDAAHRGWIDVESFSFSLERAGAAGSKHLPLVIRKPVDKASPKLLEAATRNRVLSRMEMEFIRPASGGLRFYHYVLDSIRILDFRQGIAAGGAVAVDNLSLDFQGFGWTYVEFDPNELPALDHILVWNVARGKTSVSSELAGRLKVRRFRQTSSGDFELEWLGDAGKRYAIRQADQVDGPYLPWLHVQPEANGLQTVKVPSDQSRRFFQVVQEESGPAN